MCYIFSIMEPTPDNPSFLCLCVCPLFIALLLKWDLYIKSTTFWAI